CVVWEQENQMKTKNNIQRKQDLKTVKASRKKPIQRVSIKKRSKASRSHSRKHPVPQKLGELIEMVNLLPTEILTTQDLARRAREQDLDFDHLMRNAIERLPLKLREYVGKYPLNIGGDLARLGCAYFVWERYDYIVHGQILLHGLARAWMPGKGIDLLFPQKLTLDNEGRVTFELTKLGKCILGVEMHRIRQCPICDKIYWAERKDQPCCSKSCAGALRTRRWRENYLEIYKGQRIRKANEEERKHERQVEKKTSAARKK